MGIVKGKKQKIFTCSALLQIQVKGYPKNIYICPCSGSGAKDMPSKEKC